MSIRNEKAFVGKKYSVKVINTSSQEKYISEHDAEMDARAKLAVKSAIEHAKFCKKPIARYDMKTGKAYVEYHDGKRKYIS